MRMHNSSRILITGGSGFIGTNLIDYYVSQGFAVLNIDIKPPRKKDHQGLWKECDIRDYSDFRRLVSEFKPDSILHMAARADIRGKELRDYSSNTIGVENVIKLSNEISAVKKKSFLHQQYWYVKLDMRQKMKMIIVQTLRMERAK